jgi:hypothetical protein
MTHCDTEPRVLSNPLTRRHKVYVVNPAVSHPIHQPFGGHSTSSNAFRVYLVINPNWGWFKFIVGFTTLHHYIWYNIYNIIYIYYIIYIYMQVDRERETGYQRTLLLTSKWPARQKVIGPSFRQELCVPLRIFTHLVKARGGKKLGEQPHRCYKIYGSQPQ